MFLISVLYSDTGKCPVSKKRWHLFSASFSWTGIIIQNYLNHMTSCKPSHFDFRAPRCSGMENKFITFLTEYSHTVHTVRRNPFTLAWRNYLTCCPLQPRRHQTGSIDADIRENNTLYLHCPHPHPTTLHFVPFVWITNCYFDEMYLQGNISPEPVQFWVIRSWQSFYPFSITEDIHIWSWEWSCHGINMWAPNILQIVETVPVIKFHDRCIPIAGHFVWRVRQIRILVLSNLPRVNRW